MRDRAKYDDRRREFRQRRPEHYCPHCTSVLFEEDQACVECGAGRPPSSWSLLGEGFDPCLGRILGGRYLVTRFLGVGGTGNVYRAESITILRQFAIKILDASREDRRPGAERTRVRLEREIEALSRLRNPHIVPFYEVLELPGDFLGVVMDYVEGVTLENLVNENGPLSVERACNIARQIAIGVHEAHEAGMTHRDLKPENVMIERLPLGDEFAHILDFGIVQLGDEVHVTQGFLGTPLYASPEQAMGKGVDRRSDIYSLGAIIFFMLTGRPPFLGNNSFEVLDAHIRQPPPPLAAAIPGRAFPEGMESLIARMLAKRSGDRPADLSHVIVELDQLRARAIEPADEAFARTLDSAEVVALSLHHTQPGTPVGERHHDDETSDRPALLPMRESSAEQLAQPTPSGGMPPSAELVPPKAGILRRGGTSGKFRAPRTGRVAKPATREIPLAPSEPTRTGVTQLDLVGPFPDGEPVLAAFATGGRIVLADGAQRLWLMGPGRHAEIRQLRQIADGITALCGLNGSVLVGRVDGSIEFVDVESGISRQPFGTLQGNVITALDADSEGRNIIVGTRSGRVFQGHSAHRKNALNSIQAGVAVSAVAINGHGDTFAVARERGRVELFNIGSPRTPFSQFEAGGTIRQMAFSLDGHIVALVLPDVRLVHLHHVFTGHRLMSYTGSAGRLMGVRFTQENELLGLSAVNGRIYTWDLQRNMVALPR